MKTLLTLALASAAHLSAAPIDIKIDCAKPTVPLSPHLYGLFFEDINYGADGGLYAELIQNRSFEYYAIKSAKNEGKTFHPLTAWEKIERRGASCSISVENARPLNDRNTHYLSLKIDQPGTAGVANTGFEGIPITAGASYDVSLYAHTADWSGNSDLTVSLELEDGTICGTTTLKGAGGDWKKFTSVIKADKTADNARLVVTTAGKGTLSLDMVSLFPQDTFNGHGLRKDLVQSLKDLNPKFLRFPGGCIAHGDGLANAYRWKDSVGDVAERKPNWNRWGYHQTYGLGYYEYFVLCEDLGMQPLPVLPVGVCCGFYKPFEFVAMDQLKPWIDDAIDLIEFANGPATSKWGSVRAKMGHPEPFKMEFICLGNEEHDTPEMRERFPHFVEAVRKAHPEIKILGTSGLGDGIPLYDLMTREKVHSSDEHYYESPDWFIRHQNRFDKFDRSKPKIFVGEYASKDKTLFNAVAEAAYLTGIERNGDMVDMTCYAPLFARLGHTQWEPNLIYFNNRSIVRTPSYYVQQLFGQNKGDVYLPNTITQPQDQPSTLSGQIGIGSWNSSIEVEDIEVDGRKIDPSTWTVSGGDFKMQDGRYIQSSLTERPAMSLSKEIFMGKTVTYTLRAKKTGGDEGFLVRFGSTNGQDGYWWRLGTKGNTRHSLERFEEGGKNTPLGIAKGTIENGVWYDLKIELTPGHIKCFLNGQLTQEYAITSYPISVSSTLDRSTNEVIVKLVNPTPHPVDARISLAGLKTIQTTATLISLSGPRNQQNTIDKPDAIKPETAQIKVASEFQHQLPPLSVQFIRVKSN